MKLVVFFSTFIVHSNSRKIGFRCYACNDWGGRYDDYFATCDDPEQLVHRYSTHHCTLFNPNFQFCYTEIYRNIQKDPRLDCGKEYCMAKRCNPRTNISNPHDQFLCESAGIMRVENRIEIEGGNPYMDPDWISCCRGNFCNQLDAAELLKQISSSAQTFGQNNLFYVSVVGFLSLLFVTV